MTDVVDIVTGYAIAGLPVLPLHVMRDGVCTCKRDCGRNAAKHPITRHGKDDATTDLGQIAEWFGRWPGCNWGVRPPVGTVVLDVDPRNGGATTLIELQEKNGQLPSTLTARTGSGGLHVWLSYNGPTRGRLGKGIDVKSNSGYVVAPPSVHACGGAYEWINQAPAAYAPQWVKNILNPPIRRRPVGDKAGKIDPLIKFLADATPDCDRNQRLYWAACRALDGGIDPAPLVDVAVGLGLTHHEATGTVRSAENRGPRYARRAS